MTKPSARAKPAAGRKVPDSLLEGLKKMGFVQQPGLSFDKDGTPLTTFSLKLNKKPTRKVRKTP